MLQTVEKGQRGGTTQGQKEVEWGRSTARSTPEHRSISDQNHAAQCGDCFEHGWFPAAGSSRLAPHSITSSIRPSCTACCGLRKLSRSAKRGAGVAGAASRSGMVVGQVGSARRACCCRVHR